MIEMGKRTPPRSTQFGIGNDEGFLSEKEQYEIAVALSLSVNSENEKKDLAYKNQYEVAVASNCCRSRATQQVDVNDIDIRCSTRKKAARIQTISHKQCCSNKDVSTRNIKKRGSRKGTNNALDGNKEGLPHEEQCDTTLSCSLSSAPLDEIVVVLDCSRYKASQQPDVDDIEISCAKRKKTSHIQTISHEIHYNNKDSQAIKLFQKGSWEETNKTLNHEEELPYEEGGNSLSRCSLLWAPQDANNDFQARVPKNINLEQGKNHDESDLQDEVDFSDEESNYRMQSHIIGDSDDIIGDDNNIICDNINISYNKRKQLANDDAHVKHYIDENKLKKKSLRKGSRKRTNKGLDNKEEELAYKEQFDIAVAMSCSISKTPSQPKGDNFKRSCTKKERAACRETITHNNYDKNKKERITKTPPRVNDTLDAGEEVLAYQEQYSTAVTFKCSLFQAPQDPKDASEDKKLELSSIGKNSKCSPISKDLDCSKVEDQLNEEKSRPQAAVDEQHYVSNTLKMTENGVVTSLPDHFQEEIGSVGWVNWRPGKQGQIGYRPVLVLSPFHLSGTDKIVQEWVNMFRLYRKGQATCKVLVYWYEKGWSNSANFKAFSIVNRNAFVCFKEGIEKGFDQPPHIVQKLKGGEALLPVEDNLLRGIERAKQDSKLLKDERGGPLFFPHLREKEVNHARKLLREGAKTSAARCQLEKIPKFLPKMKTNKISKQSLELCSGAGVMSSELYKEGFETKTLDHDAKKPADSHLSLAQVRQKIMDGSVIHDPHLNFDFNFIWAAPCCTTWSKAGTSLYRSEKFIDGYPNRSTYRSAQKAKQDIEDLVFVCKWYKERNKDVVICIENPEGYLHKHPVSKSFKSQLELEQLRVSYCRFSTRFHPLPRKNTLIWTNSATLQFQFGDNSFLCQNNCLAMKPDKKTHLITLGKEGKASDYAEYPSKFCSLVAGLISSEIDKNEYKKKSGS